MYRQPFTGHALSGGDVIVSHVTSNLCPINLSGFHASNCGKV